jgi:hypothetical protein
MKIAKQIPQSFQNNFSFYSEFVCSFGVFSVLHILRCVSMCFDVFRCVSMCFDVVGVSMWLVFRCVSRCVDVCRGIARGVSMCVRETSLGAKRTQNDNMKIAKQIPESFLHVAALHARQNNFSFYSEFVCSFGVFSVLPTHPITLFAFI